MKRVRPEDWYALERKADDVTLISEPFIKPFYRGNMWHVRGRDRDMLVDSGMGVVSLRTWVPLVTERALAAVASRLRPRIPSPCHNSFPFLPQTVIYSKV